MLFVWLGRLLLGYVFFECYPEDNIEADFFTRLGHFIFVSKLMSVDTLVTRKSIAFQNHVH